ncbi:MAG TPA: DNA gyrase modulator, partial [Nitrospirota bacterium]
MDRGIAEKILSVAASQKTDAAEVFIRSSSSTTIEVKDQTVDAFDRARDIGAGLRVLVNGRMGFAFSTELSDSAAESLVRAAITNARNVEPDPFHSIPPKTALAGHIPSIYDPELV